MELNNFDRNSNPMNVLFTGFFPAWSVHFVTELDLIERHLKDGDQITLLTCNKELTTCECNPGHVVAGCANCIGRRQQGVSLLSQSIRCLPLTKNIRVPTILPKELESVEQLKQLYIDGFDIGEGVYSTLVGRCMNTHPDLKLNRRLVESLTDDAYRVWHNALQLLAKERFHKVYVFNGRFNTTRAWIRACQRMNVPFTTHERSMKLGRMFLVDGSVPHDPTHYLGRINSFLQLHGSDPLVWKEGIDFFEERPKGKYSGWKSFVSAQTADKLPPGLKATKRNVVFFASTEREFIGVKQFTPNGIYESQIDALLDLIPKAVAQDSRLYFYIRIHPNSSRERLRWWEQETFRALPNTEIIQPLADISTYALMHAAEKVVCFRSSMGLEATFWGKPSIVLTYAYYAGLDAVYEPKTRTEAVDLIIKTLKPKDRINAVKFGAFMRCGGYQLEHATAIDTSRLRFKGIHPKANSDIQEWASKCFARSVAPRYSSPFRTAYDYLIFTYFQYKYRGWFAEQPHRLRRSDC